MTTISQHMHSTQITGSIEVDSIKGPHQFQNKYLLANERGHPEFPRPEGAITLILEQKPIIWPD